MCVTEVCGILKERYSPDDSRNLAVDEEHSGLSTDHICSGLCPAGPLHHHTTVTKGTGCSSLYGLWKEDCSKEESCSF